MKEGGELGGGGWLFPSEGWSLISCAAVIGKAEARTGSLLLYEDARWQAVAEQRAELAFDWSSKRPFMKQSPV